MHSNCSTTCAISTNWTASSISTRNRNNSSCASSAISLATKPNCGKSLSVCGQTSTMFMPTTVSGCGNAGWPMRVCYTVTWWSTIEENCLATTTSSSASTCYKRWSNVSSTNCERRGGQPSTGTTTIITPTLLTMRRAPMSANGPDATPTPSTMRTKTSTDNSAERNAYASCQHQRRTCKLAIFLHGYGRTNATRTESERRWYSATNTCFPPSSIVSPPRWRW